MARMFERKDTRKFDLKPRYWDPEKEEREEREKRIKAELGIREDDKDAYIPNINNGKPNEKVTPANMLSASLWCSSLSF